MLPNESNQQDYWWRDEYFEDFERNVRKPPGEWEREEPAAWLYELIRRSPEVKSGQLQLPGYEVWPPFPMLQSPDPASLILFVERSLMGVRPVWTEPPSPGTPPWPGYSDPIPSYSFDLFAADEQIKDVVLTWLAEQRSKYKCESF